MAKLDKVWQEVDTDATDTVDMEEMAQVMLLMGTKKLSKEKLEKLFNKLDRDGSGELDKNEFYVWWKKQKGKAKRAAEQIEKIRQLWVVHDSDRSGRIKFARGC